MLVSVLDRNIKTQHTMKNLKLLFSLLLCLPFLIQAQSPTSEDLLPENLEPYTSRSQFGIMLELNNSQNKFNTNDFGSVGLADELNEVRSEKGLGIGIGISYAYELNDYVSLRSQAMISFLETRYIFDLNDDSNKVIKRETANVEMPIHVVFENDTKKVSPSVVLGARYRYDLSQNTLTSKLSGNYSGYDILLDAGFGLGFQIENFRFKTELLYSRGLVNQIGENAPRTLPSSLKDSYSNQFSLRFLFYM